MSSNLRERVRAKNKSIQMGSPVQESLWPSVFLNRERKNQYHPHNHREEVFVYTDGPRYGLLKGGEGSGKSTAGVIKTLNRLRRGMDGIMVSPDFPHFKKSLWPEFRRWCPLKVVVKEQRHRLSPTWDPGGFFPLHFYNELGGISTLYCGGIEDPTGWEGPNVSFAHFDEARRHSNAEALKTLDGRVRIPGPNGEPCQIWLTTTPRKHWLYDYFGGVEPGEEPAMQPDDPKLEFKKLASVLTLYTAENEKNLELNYVSNRRKSLTEAEARVLLEAAWEDISDSEPFLPSILWWSPGCLDQEMPPPTINDALVVALDAGINNDSFGLIAVSAHPTKSGALAVQAVHEWNPKKVPEDYLVVTGKTKSLDFRKIREEIEELIDNWNVIKLVYDRTELHLMAQDLSAKVLTETFSQQTERQIADKQLLDLIRERRVWHRGEEELQKHLANANRKPDGDRKIRIVKREDHLKIDLAVCLSMACHAILEFVPNAAPGYVATGSALSGNAVEQLFELISTASN